jgi:hypothetical protein
MLSRWIRRVRGDAVRGRVHRVSIVAGGEVSIVLRFGIDEPRARELNQGQLVEVLAATPPEKKTEVS